VYKSFVSKKIQLKYFITILFGFLWLISIPCFVRAQTQPANLQLSLQKILKKTNTISNLKTVSTATCPSSPVILAVQDSLGNSIGNGQTLTCGSTPLYFDANTANPGITTPCVQTQFSSLDPLLPGLGSETFYEGSTDQLCVGPSASCISKIGTGLLNPKWSVDKIYLDPSQQHDFVFCYSGIISILTTVQLQDCWTADTLSPSKPLTSASCFTITLPPTTNIGVANYSISPASAASSLIDSHNGKAYVNTRILPTGSYTVNYTFTPPLVDGCSAVTGTFKFIIVPITVTVNSPTICAGNTATLTANGASTYSWSPSTGLSSTTGSIVTTSSATIYTVTGIKGICSATATSTITVKPSPTVTVNSAFICGNSTATLVANGATNYTWSPSTGLNTTNGNTVIATPTLTSVYTVIGKTNGCSSSATSTVTVNTSSTPTLTVNSPPTICSGETATLTVNGATNYTWSPATGLSATSGNVVTANTPSTTVYTVSGTTGSCSSTKTTTITVTPTATIQVTSNKNPICLGDSCILKASNASTYTWNPTGTLNSTTGGTVAAKPTGTGNTTYTISGSTGTCSAVPGVITLTVNSLPTLTITPSSTAICQGNSATLTASGANTYTWMPVTGLNASTGALVAAKPANTTTYSITGTNANGCSSSTTAVVTVNPTPTITINNATICTGGTATLTVNGATNYTWSPATGLSATSGNVVTANTPSTTVYTVSGTAGNCSSLKIFTLTVTSATTIQVTSNMSPICAGSSTTLTANNATTYTWNPSGSLSSTTGTSVIATPTINTTYTVSGNNGSCSAISTFIKVTVNPLPTLTLTPTSTVICSGNSVTLTAGGANTYSWTPAIGLTTTTGATVIANPGSTKTYSITGIANGCSSTKSILLQVNQLPNITITPTSTTICTGDHINLSASNGISYTWTPGNSLNNPGLVGVIASPTSSIVYTVIGADTNGCINSSIATISVSPVPLVMPTISGIACIGETINLLGNNVSGASTYLWIGPNGYSSLSQNAVIINAGSANAGTYTLSITLGSCTALDTISIHLVAMPTTAYAGKDTTIYNSSIYLTGNIPLIGTGTWSDISGGVSFANNSTANTQVTNLQAGQNVLKWAISNGACPVSYDDVIITVKSFVIPNGFSPNNDGLNDYFEINGLDEYSNTKLQVFNRWGNLVYESGDYKNNWGGKNMSGEDLSDDTYFYTLEISSKNTMKGYLVLKRK
jgi:gliding motility-associated-like protein